MDQIKSDVHERINQRLSVEKKVLQERKTKDIIQLIEYGKVDRAMGHLFYFATSDQFEELTKEITNKIDQIVKGKKQEINCFSKYYFDFLVNTCIGLSSALFEWRITSEFSSLIIDELRKSYKNLLALVPKNNQISQDLLTHYVDEIKERYGTEEHDIQEKDNSIKRILDGTLLEYTDYIISEIHQSVLYNHFVEQSRSGQSKDFLNNIWGNDYGTFLQFAMWVGATFQTTNPPLIKMVWDLNPEYWAEQLKKFFNETDFSNLPTQELTQEEIRTSLIPFMIVEKSCLLIRDIFVFTKGETGYVRYQVNPNNHNNAQKMIAEIRFIFALMEKRLKGNEPNISFKIPGTRAGLKAAEVLSKEGYSLTITLSFGLFQAVEFAKVLNQGNAKVNSVVVMNGRLAFPVRDELIETHAEDKQTYIDAAKWVGVEITRHLYHHLYAAIEDGGLGIDPIKVRIMNASLRIYETYIPDIIDIWGTPSITIFPNVRHALDKKERVFSSDEIKRNTPDEVKQKLYESEIFRQAWWIEGDAKEYCPEKKLDLFETKPYVLAHWPPIEKTLTQFLQAYAELKQLVSVLDV